MRWQWLKNLVNHKRTKHIDIKYHYIRESIESGAVRLKYCPNKEMRADAMTKPLACDQFELLSDGMGLRAID